MGALIGLTTWANVTLMKVIGALDFIGPLLLRIYLVPVFFVAGGNKWTPGVGEGQTLNPFVGLKDIAEWFGNPDWGLGLPAPGIMALLAWAAEYLGAIALAFGVAVRWVCIPLLFTMIVAATTVHWDNGWQAVHDAKSPHASEDIGEAQERLSRAKSILRQHGNYNYLTGSGSFVISNNGIEWAATYFVMLLALLYLGGGRFISVDYWLARKFGNGT